ncbi:PxxKW family cysteine-rich protein [Desulfococcaceae bacterium HSG9]|nr:PxxKW family cysteine-rich protein [Desulfococcaceae bacterium HSG9]
MNCTTIKKGSECLFMTAKGCSFNGGVCHTTVDQCDGCARSSEHASAWYCAACPEPASKWKNGNCNLATHVKAGEAVIKTKINPLKASKRASRKR